MTKATVKEVNQIIAYCESNDMCIKNVFAQILAGETQWDEDTQKMNELEPKLTKPQQEAKELDDAATSAVSQIMEREKSIDFSVDFVKREAARIFVDLYIAKPKLFKQAVQRAIDAYDASKWLTRCETKPTIKESEINPAMRDWAEKQGIEVEPLPTQQPV